MHRGYEVKEALRAQMEVQSKLHLQVEVSSLICLSRNQTVKSIDVTNIKLKTNLSTCKLLYDW